MTPKLLPLFVVLLTAFTPVIAAAGEIRGTLIKDGKPVSNARIVIATTANEYPATTDRYGAYQVLVAEKGKCRVTVIINGQKFELGKPVTSVDSSVQYNLLLENGTLKTK